MMSKQDSPEEHLIPMVLNALMTALGPMEATRFLSLIQKGRVGSVTRHRQWQQTLDQKAFFDQVFGQEAVASSD